MMRPVSPPTHSRHLACLLLGAILGACHSTTTDLTELPESPIPGSKSGGAWSCTSRIELSSLWQFLQQKYDHNDDRQITAEEYNRGSTRFANYDRNSDGALTAADFPTDTFFNGFSNYLVRFADGNDDKQITRAEWDAFGARFDPNSDGEITKAEAVAVLGDWAEDWTLFLLSFDQDHDADFDSHDLDLTFRDQDFDANGTLTGKETRGWAPPIEREEGPELAVGQSAPDFELPLADDVNTTIQLADALAEGPVALVFGSYT